MLSKDLIHLLNSRQAIAFLGAGLSADAGLPTWPQLFKLVEEDIRTAGFSTAAAIKESEARRLPHAFGALRKAGGEMFTPSFARHLQKTTVPGKYHHTVADWPFRYYVTPNYDSLLESALSAAHGSWVAVGNTHDEIRKLANDADGLVWHPHGGLALDSSKNRLVITDKDYDETYVSSPTRDALETIARDRRLVFIGFGFADPDLLSILSIVGRVSSPTRPSFAFLAQEASADEQELRDAYREKYNIEIVPYRYKDSDHSGLVRLLDAYSPFVARRSITFGSVVTETPDYDPLVTSLHVHNRLVDPTGSPNDRDVQVSLARASILSSLRTKSPQSVDHLVRNCGLIDASGGVTRSLLAKLAEQKLVSVVGETVTLAAAGEEMTRSAAAKGEVARDAFIASIRALSDERLSGRPADVINRTVAIISNFFEGLAKSRGLGLAQTIVSNGSPNNALRATALMKTLPDHLAACANQDEAFAVIDLVTRILQKPDQAISRHLGLYTQAYFAQHILGAADAVRAISRERLRGSCFVLDGTILLRLVATGQRENPSVVELLGLLVEHKAKIVTIRRFVQEAWEHADWAWRLAKKFGDDSVEMLDAARGANGYTANVLLEGYAATTSQSFGAYLKAAFDIASLPLSVAGTTAKFVGLGVEIVDIATLPGSSAATTALCAKVTEEVKASRGLSYTHPRQTGAEAEAGAIVKGIRTKELSLLSGPCADAFFVSRTRAVDRVPSLNMRVSISPDALTQWLWSSRPFGDDEARILFEQLLWELSDSGIRFVQDDVVSCRFSGMVDVAAGTLRRVAADHEDVVNSRYGAGFTEELEAASRLEFPRLARMVSDGAIGEMRKRMDHAERARAAAERNARLGGKEREELELLRAKEKERKRKALHRERSAQNRK